LKRLIEVQVSEVENKDETVSDPTCNSKKVQVLDV
jgi:hypothetical protein